MEFSEPIWSRSRLRLFKALPLVAALSVRGFAQEASSKSQRRHTAERQTETIEYVNKEYGFRFTLPESWKGYGILWSEWQGEVLANSGEKSHASRGPELRIRHPRWTKESPREDMPIMIFTLAQWSENPIVSAAPFDPAEFGRNKKYVFAVPPRWDYDFSEGYEEAEKILVPASLHTFAPAK
jgi:hypothetical protein